MDKKFKVSKEISWQSYNCIDTTFMFNEKENRFYFVSDSARVITDLILKGTDLMLIGQLCRNIFNAENEEIDAAIETCVKLLIQEGIICDEK